jgi:hypothetical protein
MLRKAIPDQDFFLVFCCGVRHNLVKTVCCPSIDLILIFRAMAIIGWLTGGLGRPHDTHSQYHVSPSPGFIINTRASGGKRVKQEGHAWYGMLMMVLLAWVDRAVAQVQHPYTCSAGYTGAAEGCTSCLAGECANPTKNFCMPCPSGCYCLGPPACGGYVRFSGLVVVSSVCVCVCVCVCVYFVAALKCTYSLLLSVCM